MTWPSPRLIGTRWRDRVADPAVLATCLCGHAEQQHAVLHGACTAGTFDRPCACGGFREKQREQVA
jgi:hypothetical protein